MITASAAEVSPLFAVLTLVMALAVVVSLLLIRFRQSLLVGYLLCGMLIGNFGMLWLTGMEKDSPVIANLSEIGVILLMFTLGIEFSLSELRHLWRTALVGGGLQMGITAGLAGLCAAWLGYPFAECMVLGVVVGMSSTAVAMKTFHDLGQHNNPGARASLGIALFQDILVIVFFLVMPVLYQSGEGGVVRQLAVALLKGVLFLSGAVVFGLYGLNPLLHLVARTRSRELFTLTVIGLCAGVAYAGSALDLSLALGAFTAGLVVSESIYSHRILSDILPFKDLFLAIFFIAVGLMVDVRVIADDWLRILLLSAGILTIKAGIVFGVLKWIRLPGRPALLAAGSLASMGEFSLVLMGRAGHYRPLDPALEQTLLICTAVTMAVVPSLMRAAAPFGKWLEKRGILASHQLPAGPLNPLNAIKHISDHAIICGYGPVGRALNESLKRCGVQTLVLELNADTVRTLKHEQQLVLFADATHPEALDLAGIGRARLVAFTFPAVDSTCAAIPLVRERNNGICIFGRAKFPEEVTRLRQLGVQVVHDERESAVAMIRAAMTSYDRPDINPEEIVGETMKQG
ncbi:MAG: cation:proton antiporter [Akkermansiaceae bacterium]|nr:cation:proton antiporter [Akkermansiaceae bacterium]